MNIFQVKRLILRYENANAKSLIERAEEREKVRDIPPWNQDVIDKMHNDLWISPALAYMRGRGFTDDILKFFEVGYSAKKNIVAVPMYAENNMPVGVIGRRLPPVDKKYRFQNSKNLPKRLIPWNIHNARKTGDTVIICEAAFDAMSIHQAGYENVVAVLGGHLSPWHQQVIDKTFSRIIIMTDFDPPTYEVDCAKCKNKGYRICNGHRAGRDFGRQIISSFPHKRVMWAAYDDYYVYPGHVKDANKILEEYGEEAIAQCLRNAISNFEYVKWNLEDTLAS